MGILIIFIFAFITFLTIEHSIFGSFAGKGNIVKARLRKINIENQKEKNTDLNLPLFTRLVEPIINKTGKVLLRLAPKGIILSFERKIVLAGSPFNLSVRGWLNIQSVFVLFLPAISIFFGIYKIITGDKLLLVTLLEVVTGLFLPIIYLNKKVKERQKKIIISLPDTLDLLTVSVEAGLGFDAAITRVIEKMPGPLSYEFDRVMQEIKVGKQKKDALKDMAAKLCVPDLTAFISSVIQADQLGVSIGNVLRIQSEQMRQKRRQRAQEKAMKAPVKMVIPMVLFIFPTIFSVLLGPVVIRILNTLK